MKRRKVLAGVSAVYLALPRRAGAQSRTITLFVGFAPGGPADTLARVVAEQLATRTGQPVVV